MIGMVESATIGQGEYEKLNYETFEPLQVNSKINRQTEGRLSTGTQERKSMEISTMGRSFHLMFSQKNPL